MTAYPACPSCARPLGGFTRTAGPLGPDEPLRPDVTVAQPCGCRLTPRQADRIREEMC